MKPEIPRIREEPLVAQHEADSDPEALLAKIGEGRSVGKYREHEVVFSQGQRADAVFYIQEGRVKITVVSEHGKEAIVAILGDGQFFGVECLARQTLRVSTATAVAKSSIMRLEKATMIRLIHEEPLFSEKFAQHLLHRTIRAEADLVDQLFNSSERRLARVLLLLANYGGEGAPKPMLEKVTQQMLAEMIGTTRSRVSFFMNRFREAGYIDYNGRIEVHRSLLNAVLSERPKLS